MVKNRTKLLIDGSVLIYRIAAALESRKPRNGKMIWTHSDFELARETLENAIKHFYNKLNCDEIVIALDDKNNFRTKVYPEYKSNRKKR